MAIVQTALDVVGAWSHQAEIWFGLAGLAIERLWRKLTRKPNDRTFSDKLETLCRTLRKIVIGVFTLKSAVELERSRLLNLRDIEREKTWTSITGQKTERKNMETIWQVRELIAEEHARAFRQQSPLPDQLWFDYRFDSRRIN